METSDNSECQIYRVNNNLHAFSPCGKFFAIAYQSNLVIKKTVSFETIHSYEFDDVIECLEWSPNAQYVLCASLKKATVRVFSIFYPEWKCKLVESSAGMNKVTWSQDSTNIISFADFNIQISIWSLQTQNVTYIQNLKSLTSDNVAFSPNGKSLAVITTDDGKDSVEIYKTEEWKISRKLLCEKLTTIDGLSWSPNSELLCIWCSISGQTKLLIYSTISDSHVGAFSPETSDTRKNDATGSIGIYNGPKGIERVSWNPSGQLLALAAHNETIVLLNYVTWKPILELRCEPVITNADYLGKVYRECTLEARASNMNFGQGEKHRVDEIIERPVNVPIVANTRRNSEEPSIAEIDIFEFSSCGRYLAIRHQVYSSTILIWDIAEDIVDHLLLKRSISNLCWNPCSPRLMIFTESPLVFEWRAGRGATCYSSPRGITALSGQWHPHGRILALCGYNKTAIMRLTE